MIGQYLKSVKNLLNSLDYAPRTIILIRNDYFDKAKCIKVSNDKLLIFNNISSNTRFHIEDYFGYPNYSDINELRCNYSYVIELNEKGGSSLEWFKLNIHGTLVFPENFEENYSKFLTSNSKQIALAQTKYCFNDQNGLSLYLYSVSNANITFFIWAIKNVFYNHVHACLVNYVLTWNEMYSNLVGKLKRGTITAYNGTEAIQVLISEINHLRRKKRANDSIMMFNTAQKHLLKDIVLSDNTEDKSVLLLNKFGKLSEQKQQNFIRKMSTIDNKDYIIKEMSFLCDMHFDWNKASFMEYLKENEFLNCKLVYENENVVVLQVYDYETIKRFAKNTNWCISKNKRYWNDYVEFHSNNDQFIVFDFSQKEDSELSIFGFTTRNKRNIIHAHSFSNANLMEKIRCYFNQLESFDPISSNGIYDVLVKCKIPFDVFLEQTKSPFEWNKDAVIEYMTQNLDSNNWVIIQEEDDKLAVLVEKDPMIVRMFSREDLASFETDWSITSSDVIMFFDFSKKETDSDKFLLSIIHNNGKEEFGTYCFDSRLNETSISFDKMLNVFKLPYTTIKRVDNIYNRFSSALSSFDISLVLDFLSNPTLVSKLKQNLNKCENNSTYLALRDSLFNYHSLSLLNAIYDSGLTLSSLMNVNEIASLTCCLIDASRCRYNWVKRQPTAEDFVMLHNHMIQHPDKCRYFGFMEALKMIFEKDGCGEIALQYLTNEFLYRNYMGGFTDYLLSLTIPFIPFETIESQDLENIVNRLINFKKYDFVQFIYDNCSSNALKKKIKDCVPSLSFA